MFVFSYGNSTGESSRGLLSAIHTYDKDGSGNGSLNRFRYSNPAFDAAVVAAAQIFDADAREAALQAAAAIAAADTAVVPLYFQALSWASTSDVAFTARRDERTLAMGARPAE